MKVYSLIITLAIMTGCANNNHSENGKKVETELSNLPLKTSMEKEVKLYVSKMTFAPEKAKFKNLKAAEYSTVCGEVNGQSSQGEDLGFVPFYYQNRNGKVFARIKPQGGIKLALFNSIYKVRCK